jgi:hypothetical protein
MGWGKLRSDWIAKRVDTVRAMRRNQGHELTQLQEAIVTTIAHRDPAHNSDAAKELAAIKQALITDGRWSEQREWRIMTWFDSEIVRNETGRYVASVRCDGQLLSCESPSIERAFGFLHLYEQLILYGFYSVGPPWADFSPFES